MEFNDAARKTPSHLVLLVLSIPLPALAGAVHELDALPNSPKPAGQKRAVARVVIELQPVGLLLGGNKGVDAEGKGRGGRGRRRRRLDRIIRHVVLNSNEAPILCRY